MTRAVLVEPSTLVRTALARVLPRRGYTVLGGAGLAAGVRAELAAEPELVLLAAQDGAVRAVLDLLPAGSATRLLVLGRAGDHEQMLTAFREGAQGFVGRDASLDHLLGAAAAVLRGEAAVPRHMLGALLHDLVQQGRQQRAPGSSVLSPREQQVLELLAEGHAQDGIARALVISQQTARAHIQRVVSKLGAHSRAEAVALAQEQGLLVS